VNDESLLQAILNTAVEGIITIDERGLIQLVNPAAEKLFGYSASELIGSNVKVLMPSPFRESHDQYIERYRETGVRKIIGIGRDVIGKRKDGTEFPMSLAVSEFFYDSKRLFAGFIQDLTPRRQAEEAEQSLGRIIDGSLNEIYIFDAQTLRFIQVNRGAQVNLGYSMDELREMTPVDIQPKFTLGTFSELILPLSSGENEQLVFETILRRKNNSCYNADIHLQTSLSKGRSCYTAFVLDVTQRKLAEDELRVQRRAMEAAVNGILITDPTQDDNPIVYVNPAFEKITGYAAQEILGRNCRFLQNDQRDQPAIEALRAAILKEQKCTVELRNFRKDGTPFWNELSVSPVRNSDGELTHFVGIQTDVTLRKQAEESLERLNDELEKRVQERTTRLQEAQELLVRKEKLATLGQLAGGVAHEIRNPLGVIRNAAYYLQQTQTDADQDTSEALQEISRGLTNSERIVGELLDYARGPQSSGDAIAFAFNEALLAALTMVGPPSSISITHPESAVVFVFADRAQIERLLINVIQNAVQSMPKGGNLEVRYAAMDDRVLIEVADTGEGISPADMEKIFEPLFTKRAKGIGLGLSLSRSYAEQNGGTLTARSVPGLGSTFILNLPQAKQQPNE
jgi:two-component system, cell cycle sensor histidine kinase and response regulator CckA